MVRAALAMTAVSAIAGGTAHASTLTVKVDPPDAGTTQAPRAHTTSIGIDNMAPGPGGNAKSALVSMVHAMPAEFARTLGGYTACPSAKVVHGDNKPDCPDSSIVGTAAGSAYVPALLFRTTSDRGYIFKLSDTTVRAWIHFSSPQETGIPVNGTFTAGAAPYGPTITWDLSRIANGAESGVEVRVNSASFIWTTRVAAAAAPAAPGSTTAKTKKLRATCRKRAERVNNKRKRQRALRRCAKLKAKAAPVPPPSQSATQSALSSTGCAGGSWPFRAEMSFADGTKETAEATAACTRTESAAPPSSPPPSSPGPLCPPLCSVFGVRQ
jgi:hypothetical protein